MARTMLRWIFTALAAVGLIATGSNLAAAEQPTGSSVGIQMFGWNWDSLANECRDHLGPNGFDWILTLPPQEHKNGNQWWVHFQPVSYQLDSYAGTREQFTKMVAACNAAGVKVYTDAVINHMAGGSGIGSAGTEFTTENFPLFTTSDFHDGIDKSDPHYCNSDISNWNALDERTNCRFPGLPDLATEKPSVRQKIAAFLNDQLSLGVSGFRIDAAKHMPPADLAAIKALLTKDAYFVQEIPGPTSIANEYLGVGDAWAWDQQQYATDMFSTPGYAHLGKTFDSSTKEYIASANAVTWVTNHDTDHHGGAVTYMQGKLYPMSFAWILAEPYGKPMLYSGYSFFDENSAAPLNVNRKIENAICASSSNVLFNPKSPTESLYDQGEFTCVERWTSMAGMIAWRDQVAQAPKQLVYAKAGAYGFARGKAGYVLFNSNARTFTASKIKTGLAAGSYCDLYSGGKSPVNVKRCKGTTVVIAKDGTLTTKVAGLAVLAITASTRIN